MLNGLKNGLKTIAEALSMRHRAVTSGNDACAEAVDKVFRIWFTEITGVVIGVKNVDVMISFFALLMGDPFMGSRQAFRKVQEAFPGV